MSGMRPGLFAVSRQTMLHQLRFPVNLAVAEGGYAFCANRECDAGYVSATAVIPKTALRVFRAGQPAMLCYCFDISEAAYRAALADGSAAALKAFVVKETRAGQCACEVRSPAGRCCLADFRSMEQQDAE